MYMYTCIYMCSTAVGLQSQRPAWSGGYLCTGHSAILCGRRGAGLAGLWALPAPSVGPLSSLPFTTARGRYVEPAGSSLQLPFWAGGGEGGREGGIRGRRGGG